MVNFKLYDAAETDALTSIQSTMDKFQVFAKLNRKISPVGVIRLQETVNSTKVTFNIKHRQELNELIQYLQSTNADLVSKDDIRAYVKIKPSHIDLQLKTSNYSWMNPIQLRITK